MAQGSSNKNFLKQKIRACAACSNQPDIFRYYLRHKPFNGGFAPEVSNKFFIHLRKTDDPQSTPESAKRGRRDKESVAA
ncbi:MAG: DUF2490 domain-containing protein [Hydrococcus sp. Prado102]|jgi:hypothetical protein|nr:DUF2490 domain-containing protein [Hydrococcus sp. Prado102]